MTERGRADSIQPRRVTFAKQQSHVTGQVRPGREVPVISDSAINLMIPKWNRAGEENRLVGAHGRIVERYEKDSIAVMDVISPSSQSGATPVSDTEIFVNYKWDNEIPPKSSEKRSRGARVLSNAKSLGKVFVAQEDETGQQPSNIYVSQNSLKRPLSSIGDRSPPECV